MIAPRFQAIRASAGTGKTFRLAHRYIRLMAEGVSPDEIVALTFTRKAAGEIFDTIVGYVSAAASDHAAAAQTMANLGGGAPAMTQSDYVALLRRLLEAMHRLRIGTIDSFTVGIVRSFPLELGIPSSFETMDGGDAATRAFRRRIIDEMFDSAGATRGERARLLGSFAQARLGRTGKGVEEPLSSFIAQYQEQYRVLPDADRWGEPAAVWPRGNPWLEAVDDIHKLAERFRACVQGLGPSDAHHDRFCDFADAAACHSPYSGWEGPLKYMMEKLLECEADLRSGCGTVKLNRTEYELAGDIALHALALMSHVIATELKAAMERTRGIYHVIDMYDTLYDAAVRREGRLTFVDIQHLLTGHCAGGRALTGRPGADDEATRLYIDYRLDAHLNHWLLDEFQDTSDLQWDVLGNLIDEVLQDDSGTRSFFYVGDVKQAIYGWRGGNPELFDMLLNRYPVIEPDVLHLSRRSAQPVIDTVNAVFETLPAEELPAGVTRRWTFDEHETIHADPSAGCAMLLEPAGENPDGLSRAEHRYRVAAGILRDIDPTHRRAAADGGGPLTAAVLVRTNEQGKAVVDLLRRECPGVTVIHEGRAAIKDNPVVAVLLSLIAAAAHPGNTLAWRHLEMSPLAEGAGRSRDTLARRFLRHVQAHGFQSLLRDWGERLHAACPLDAYGRKRLGELLAAATEFDATGSRDCDEFVDFIDSYELHEQAADDAVRVMTVHQAKGLEFDVVILPDLDDRQSMAKSRDLPLALARDPETNRPLWALEMPRRAVVDADPVLAAQAAKVEEDAALESLCLLYVAMTRAKRALYVITSFPGASSKAFTQPAFLKLQLARDTKPAASDADSFEAGGESSVRFYSAGDTTWYESLPRVTPPPAAGAPTIAATPAEAAANRRLVALRPSDADDAETDASALFNEDRRHRKELGSAVHAVLQSIEWLDDPAGFSPPPVPAEANGVLWESAITHVLEALAKPAIARVFLQPGVGTSVWRERRFEVVRGDEWITGSFDRVVVHRDGEGRPTKATIYDFKTDEVSDPAAVKARATHYASQMKAYRDILSRMLGLPPAGILLQLVFTGAGVVRTVE